MPDTEDIKTFTLSARRVDEHGSLAHTKEADIVLDTSVDGRVDAANPVELLLASLSACMLKGIERHSPAMPFAYSSAAISLTARRPALEARVTEIDYVLTVDTTESDSKLELLHKNLLKFGTIYNTLAPGTTITGRIQRGAN
ncbi:putative OsmC-like protein [Aurantimicrobium minutum]|uniref:OsmC family protein n=1 Tax=Aurantimicrobium minutum TaxID=708131 RepID=UPI0024763104|nr:OsmC family protein [Aurantimicrobium minutum]MDH6531950.1 putative OsmC-like protein [Aurantimicrobium minutum]